MNKNSITAIILTYNEEKHITRCINSLKGICTDILVIDSFSKDKTCEISKNLGARVSQNPFVNQATQFNWALNNCSIKTEWIWRVDADEYIEPLLAEKVQNELQTIANDVNGIYVNKKIIFMGRALLHGGWYPAQQIKVIRKGFGASENKWIDEHLIIFSGKAISVNADQTDENLNDLSLWTQKHNNYANREAINMLMMRYGLDDQTKEVQPKLFGTEAERKRWLKVKYARTPLFVRPIIYFFIRYVLKVGFIDGKEGFIWHFLQGFWYRFLVDAKIYEIKKRFGGNEEKIKEYIIENYLKKEG